MAINKRLKVRQAEARTKKAFEKFGSIEDALLEAIRSSEFQLREEDGNVKDGIFYIRGSFHKPVSPTEAPNQFVEFYDCEPPIFGGLLVNFLVKNPDFINWAARAVQLASYEVQKSKKLLVPEVAKKGRQSNLKIQE